MTEEIARLLNDDVIVTLKREYRFSKASLLMAEMQGSLGYVIASAFRGPDRNADRPTMKLVRDAVRAVLKA